MDAETAGIGQAAARHLLSNQVGTTNCLPSLLPHHEQVDHVGRHVGEAHGAGVDGADQQLPVLRALLQLLVL